MIISHIESLLISVIEAQLPHQELKVPLTSGIVKGTVTSLISTINVILYSQLPSSTFAAEL